MLAKSVLSEGFRRICDKDHLSFEGFPERGDVGRRWSSVFALYMAGCTFQSTTSTIAKEAMSTTLQASLGAPNAFTLALSAYFTAYIPGMLPAFVGTPPIIPLDSLLFPIFATGFAGANGSTIAESLATALDVYVRSATATPSVGGSPIPFN